MKKIKIAIICGGPSNEHEVSLKTGQMIVENIDESKYDIHSVKIGKNNRWNFDEEKKSYNLPEALNQLTERKFELAFIGLHGVFGEDGHIQAILDSIGMPYTGSGMLASAVIMDKDLSNKLYSTVKMSVPRYQVLEKNDEPIKIKIPYIVKPLDGGSSIGMTIVDKTSQTKSALNLAFAESKRIMVQEYIKGREFTCAVLDNKDGMPIPLSPIEIIPKVSRFFDYRAKYEDGGSEEIVNPNIGAEKLKEIQELALKAHNVLGCSGMSRTDFIEKNGNYFIIETNTIPGMTKNSLLPKSAEGSGIKLKEVIELLIINAFRKRK